MFTPIKGKACIVTGASSGIGRAMALTFAKAGCAVLVVGRSEERCAQTVQAIAAEGGEAAYFIADVADRQRTELMAERCLELFGRLDILCANAGVIPCSRLDALDEKELDEVLNINVKGTFHSVMAVQGQMRRQRSGRIIVTSSITGPITGFPGWSHYGASKAAQMGFVHTAAIELAPYGITVNAVLPGNVMTEGLRELGQAYIDQMAASVPLGYIGSAFDIAHAALFLATDEARYITGQGIVIDGGQIFPESLSALDAVRGEYRT